MENAAVASDVTVDTKLGVNNNADTRLNRWTSVLVAAGFLPEVVKLYVGTVPQFPTCDNADIVLRFANILVLKNVRLLTAVQPQLVEVFNAERAQSPTNHVFDTFIITMLRSAPANDRIIPHSAIESVTLDSWQSFTVDNYANYAYTRHGQGFNPSPDNKATRSVWFYRCSTTIGSPVDVEADVISGSLTKLLGDHNSGHHSSEKQLWYCRADYSEAFNLIFFDINGYRPRSVHHLGRKPGFTLTDNFTTAIRYSTMVRTRVPAVCVFEVNINELITSQAWTVLKLNSTERDTVIYQSNHDSGYDPMKRGINDPLSKAETEAQRLMVEVKTTDIVMTTDVKDDNSNIVIIKNDSIVKLIASKLVGVLYLNPNPAITF